MITEQSWTEASQKNYTVREGTVRDPNTIDFS